MGLRRAPQVLAREGKLEGSHRGGRRGQKPFSFSFLLLHPAVLEPDFDLGVVQLQGVGYLDAPGSGQVLIEMKLLLQFCQLLGAEIRADRAGGASGSTLGELACNIKTDQIVSRG